MFVINTANVNEKTQNSPLLTDMDEIGLVQL